MMMKKIIITCTWWLLQLLSSSSFNYNNNRRRILLFVVGKPYYYSKYYSNSRTSSSQQQLQLQQQLVSFISTTTTTTTTTKNDNKCGTQHCYCYSRIQQQQHQKLVTNSNNKIPMHNKNNNHHHFMLLSFESQGNDTNEYNNNNNNNNNETDQTNYNKDHHQHEQQQHSSSSSSLLLLDRRQWLYNTSTAVVSFSALTSLLSSIELLTTQVKEVHAIELSSSMLTTFPSFIGRRNKKGSSSSSNDDLYGIRPEKESDVGRGQLAAQPELLTSELCLLRTLPLGKIYNNKKQTFFRELQITIEAISNLKTAITSPTKIVESSSTTYNTNTNNNTNNNITAFINTVWIKAGNDIANTIDELDKKRVQLEPVFVPDDSTQKQIWKNERFEILIESLRTQLVQIMNVCYYDQNITSTLYIQKLALLTLADIGELLVPTFPYKVPAEGKYSYLPRLLGRAKVTFTIRRNNNKQLLGNITIIADGYIAPVTAGNFIDLCERNFYTGLPIKFVKKRIGYTTTTTTASSSTTNNNDDSSSLSSSSFDIATIPILGSYNEGFYDPLTGKLRRLPLELIRVEKGSNEQDLFYTQGLSNLIATNPGSSTTTTSTTGTNTNETKTTSSSSTSTTLFLEPPKNSKPLLSFKIPGLVAMYHPDRNLNGASSEFFCLQKDSVPLDDQRSLFDGEYAPFGYIIDGYELYQTIQPNDVIDKTIVDSWGITNLIKLRKSSFTEVVQASDVESVK